MSTAVSVTHHPDIDSTISYVQTLYNGVRDKAGVPYIAHLLGVMRRVDPYAWHVALLHDAIEDGKVTSDGLLRAGYTVDEVSAVSLVTKRYNERYTKYIDHIATSGNMMAITVKIADLEDNMDLTRMCPDGWWRSLNARYQAAHETLCSALRNLQND